MDRLEEFYMRYRMDFSRVLLSELAIDFSHILTTTIIIEHKIFKT